MHARTRCPSATTSKEAIRRLTAWSNGCVSLSPRHSGQFTIACFPSISRRLHMSSERAGATPRDRPNSQELFPPLVDPVKAGKGGKPQWPSRTRQVHALRRAKSSVLYSSTVYNLPSLLYHSHHALAFAFGAGLQSVLQLHKSIHPTGPSLRAPCYSCTLTDSSRPSKCHTIARSWRHRAHSAAGREVFCGRRHAFVRRRARYELGRRRFAPKHC